MTPGGDGRKSEGGEHAPAVRLEAERGVSPGGLRPHEIDTIRALVERDELDGVMVSTRAHDRRQLLDAVGKLSKQVVESRNLARWAIDFLPKDSPGRLAAEAVMAEWGEQWTTPKPEGAT